MRHGTTSRIAYPRLNEPKGLVRASPLPRVLLLLQLALLTINIILSYAFPLRPCSLLPIVYCLLFVLCLQASASWPVHLSLACLDSSDTASFKISVGRDRLSAPDIDQTVSMWITFAFAFHTLFLGSRIYFLGYLPFRSLVYTLAYFEREHFDQVLEPCETKAHRLELCISPSRFMHHASRGTLECRGAFLTRKRSIEIIARLSALIPSPGEGRGTFMRRCSIKMYKDLFCWPVTDIISKSFSLLCFQQYNLFLVLCAGRSISFYTFATDRVIPLSFFNFSA